MKSLACLACLALCVAVVACGSSGGSGGSDIASFFPADGEVAGWNEDTTVGSPGVDVARTATEVEALVNGDATPFSANGFVAFGWQTYTDGTYLLDFRIWEMADAAACQTLYAYLVTDVPVYMANTWEDQALGDGGRVADGAGSAWTNACTGAYFLEAKVVKPDPADTAARGHAISFTQAVVAKIP